MPLHKKQDGTFVYEFEKRTAPRGIQSVDLFIASCALVVMGLLFIFGYSPYYFPVLVVGLVLLYPAKRLQKKEIEADLSKERPMSPVDIDEGYIESNRTRRHFCQSAGLHPFDTFILMSQRYFRSHQIDEQDVITLLKRGDALAHEVDELICGHFLPLAPIWRDIEAGRLSSADRKVANDAILQSFSLLLSKVYAAYARHQVVMSHEAADANEVDSKKAAKAAEKQFALEQAARIEQMEANARLQKYLDDLSFNHPTPPTD